MSEERLAKIIRQVTEVLMPDSPVSGRISRDRTHVAISSIPCYDGLSATGKLLILIRFRNSMPLERKNRG